VRWHWNLGDGTVRNATTNAPVQHTYPVWGDKTIKLVVENSKGCISDTLVRTVRVHPLPQIGFVIPEICLDDALALFRDTTRMADGSAGLSYFWQFNAGNPPVNPGPSLLTSTAQNPSVVYNSFGNYTVKLRVTSAAGCVDSVNRAFTVNGSIPKSDFDILTTNNRCSNRDVEIRNRSTVNFGWLTRVEIFWDVAGNPTVFETDEDPQPNEVYAHRYPVFQSPATRDFQIRFRAYSGGVCVNEVVKTVTVNASPLVQFSPMPGICVDAVSRQITEAVETAGLPGTGIYSGPGVSSTGLFNPAAAGVGVHTLLYKFITTAGCVDSMFQTIEVWPRPVAKFDVVLPSCEKNIVAFSDNSEANAASLSTWQWTFGDGSAPVVLNTPTGFRHTYSTYGTYPVTLVVTNNRGCNSLPFQLPVKVHPLPRVDFSLPVVCLPVGEASFKNLSAIPDGTENSFRYRWDFGDGFANPPGSDTSVVKDPVYYYKNLGPYPIQLKVTSSNGCVDSLTRQLTTVYPQPKARFSSVDSLCLGTPVRFNDNSDGAGSAIRSWHWSFDNGDSSRVQNPVYAFRTQGLYNVKLFLYTSEGCISDTATRQVAVWDYPVISAGPDIFVLEDGVKRIQDATAKGIGLTFLWRPPLYLSDTTVLNPVINQPKDDITYRLTVTGRGNCSVSDEVFVKVLRFPKPPNTFTPNGDGVNDTWVIQNLSDYPGCIVEVYNTAGSLVFRSIGYTTPWDGTWKGQKLPVGTYYYVIDPKNGRSKQAGYVTILR
jgi:gliding motility-associated-like protein